MSIKVAIVEDDRRVRKTLAEILASTPDFECAAEFSTGEDAVAQLPGVKPDVVIMDIHLPAMNGVETVGKLAGRVPGMQILMLTVFQDADTIFQALSAGAHGYLLKPVTPAQLRDAIRDVRAGGSPISPSIARKVIEAFRAPFSNPPPAPAADADAAGELSQREHDALRLLAQGCTYKEIADELKIKVPTVGTYVHRIYEKLHVRSRREIIRRFGTRA